MAEQPGAALRALVESVLTFVAIFCATLLTVTLVGALGGLPAVLRWMMLGTLAIVTFVGAAALVVAPLVRLCRDDGSGAAKRPANESHTDALIADVMKQEYEERAGEFGGAFGRYAVLKAALAAALALIFLLGYAFWFNADFSRGIRCVFHPAANVEAEQSTTK